MGKYKNATHAVQFMLFYDYEWKWKIGGFSRRQTCYKLVSLFVNYLLIYETSSRKITYAVLVAVVVAFAVAGVVRMVRYSKLYSRTKIYIRSYYCLMTVFLRKTPWELQRALHLTDIYYLNPQAQEWINRASLSGIENSALLSAV